MYWPGRTDSRWMLWFLFVGGAASLLGTVAYSALHGWTQVWVVALEIGIVSTGFIGCIFKGPQHRIALIAVLTANAFIGFIAFTKVEAPFGNLLLFASAASMVGAAYQPERAEEA